MTDIEYTVDYVARNATETKMAVHNAEGATREVPVRDLFPNKIETRDGTIILKEKTVDGSLSFNATVPTEESNGEADIF